MPIAITPWTNDGGLDAIEQDFIAFGWARADVARARSLPLVVG
jgi:hypothetical protein